MSELNDKLCKALEVESEGFGSFADNPDLTNQETVMCKGRCDGTGQVHISSWEHCWTDGFGDWCSFNRPPSHSEKHDPEGWCFKYAKPLYQEKSGPNEGFGKRLHKCVGEHGLDHLQEDEDNPTSIQCPTCQGHPERKITLLQKVLEERGEWGSFMIQLNIIEHASVLPDANAQLRAVATWREVKV